MKQQIKLVKPKTQKTKSAIKEIKEIFMEELTKALNGNYIVEPSVLVPSDNRQQYRYLTDSSQFPLKGATVSNIKLGQGIPTISVKQDFELAYDGGLGSDSYRDIRIEVVLYTLPIYKRVVVMYATNKQKDATCFETFCQQQGIKYVKLDKPSKDRKKTIQQMIGAIDSMDKLYQANHHKKGTKQCKE